MFYWIKTTTTTENFDLTLLIKTNLTMSLSNDKSSASNTHFGGLVLVAKVSLCLVDIVASLKRLPAMESMCHSVLALHMAQVVVCFAKKEERDTHKKLRYRLHLFVQIALYFPMPFRLHHNCSQWNGMA